MQCFSTALRFPTPQVLHNLSFVMTARKVTVSVMNYYINLITSHVGIYKLRQFWGGGLQN
jgi:hypothetical protein